MSVVKRELGRRVRYASLGYQIEAPPTTRSGPATTNPNQSIKLHSGTRPCRKTYSTDDDANQLRLTELLCELTFTKSLHFLAFETSSFIYEY